MKPLPTLLPLLLLTLCIPSLLAAPETESNPDAPEAVVRAFLAAIPDQQIDALRELLADTKTCHITQESDPQRPGVWTETWEEWLKWLPTTEQSVHVVDKLSMAKLSPDLALVTLNAHIDIPATNVRAVIVLTRKQDARWKILSWTQENSVPPAKP